MVESWIFFVVVALTPFGGGDAKFGGKLFGAYDSERACRAATGHVEIAHGQELLHITPCIKVPNREKL